MNEQSSFEKLGALIKDIDIAMLTTVTAGNALRSRPMATQRLDFDGSLWFFTSAASAKSEELQQHAAVNVSYAAPSEQRYVSVSGRATLVRDAEKVKEMWNPIYRAWFPKGLDDPNLALIRVNVETAEYWDVPSSTMVQIVGFVKAMVTGTEYAPGEHEKISM